MIQRRDLMRRLSAGVTRVRAALVAMAAFVTSLFDELVLTLALLLIVYGLWPWVGRLSLVIPGAVLLWFLPARGPFVERSQTDLPVKRRSN